MNLKGKRLLILGGANVHCKVVKAAKELGLHTIVTDYLCREDSPAKMMADESYDIDIKNVDSIVELCRKKKVDGVISLFLDPAQRPYYEICKKLRIPCYMDSWEQVYALTDKDAFKKTCIECGVDIIQTFDEDSRMIDYPVLVKPAHSRGSRGQTICKTSAELSGALKVAKAESDNNEAIIEKYMGNQNDFTMTYFCINGTPYLVRTADRLLGSHDNGLEKVAMAELTPSRYQALYLEEIDSRIKSLIRRLGIQNGPVFMQGFIDGHKLRVYDPGFRFPGTEFDVIFTDNMGVDLIKKMIYFSIFGCFPSEFGSIDANIVSFNKKVGLELWPCVKKGVIDSIIGFDIVKDFPEVRCITMRHKEGDEIGDWRNVNQRLAEIDLLCDDVETLKKVVAKIHSTISCKGLDGTEMLYNRLNLEEI